MLTTTRPACLRYLEGRVDKLFPERYHRQLIDKKNWDCALPSRALAVLGLLGRSGTVVTHLECAASEALHAMTPSMTKNEQLALKKYSRFWGLGNIGGSTESPISLSKAGASDENGDTCVLKLYSFFLGECDLQSAEFFQSAVLDKKLIASLGAPTSLMLLEMICSSKRGILCRRDEVVPAVLSRLHYHVLCNELISFKALWWIVDLLCDKREPLIGSPTESSHLFRACLRRLHELMPRLSLGECLLLFPSLNCSPYGRPFVMCGDICRRLLFSTEEELSAVPTDVIVNLASCQGVGINVARKLCHALYTDFRIGFLDSVQSIRILSVVAKEFASEASTKDDLLFCESLFAQLYANTQDMSAAECIRVMEYLELLGLPPFSVSASCELLERLKKKVLEDVRHLLKRQNAKTDEFEPSLQLLYRLEGLLKRCCLLPFLSCDAMLVSGIIDELKGQLKHP